MAVIEKSFSVGGRKITVIYDFSFYTAEVYKKDFKDFLDYQDRRFKKAPEKDEFDWKFYNVKDKRFISFEEFVYAVTNFLTRVFERILGENSGIMVSDEPEFKLRIIVRRVPNRAWYIEENPNVEMKEEEYEQFLNDIEAEEVEHHNYLVSGSFLIQSVAAPWHWLKKVDYTYLYRYFVHELEHHVQKMMKFYEFQEEVAKRLRTKVKKAPNYRATWLFLSAQALLNEGIADFKAIANRPTLDFHMDWIRKFRQDLDALTTMTGKNKIEEFWVDNIGYGVFAGGAYYCGKMMSFTIALAIAKKSGIPVRIVFRELSDIGIGQIDERLSGNTVLNVTVPPESVLELAYKTILETNYDYRKFIRLYESACHELGISQSNMVIWWELFDALKKKATRFYQSVAREKQAEVYEKVREIIQSSH